MNQYVKNYAMYLAFAVVTAVVVAPLAKQFSIPFVKDL